MPAAKRKEQKTTEVNQSLLAAFISLFAQLGRPVDAENLSFAIANTEDDDLWDVVSRVDKHVIVSEEGDYGTFPVTNNAIIKFQYQDPDNPYTEVNGERTANTQDHYCLVSHHGERLILDDDGLVKNSHIYGQPVAWASYEVLEKIPQAETPAAKPGTTYKVLKGGENGWQIAQKLGIPGKELKEHVEDDIEDFGNIPGGTVLHLPYVVKNESRGRITEFEILPKSLQMHISKEGGTRKYTFGNIATGIKPSGPTYQQDRNVNIFAIAHVPVDDNTVVDYYMEASEFDPATRKVRWTIGFAKDDLAEGHVEKKKPEPKPQVKEQIKAKVDEAAQKRADELAQREEIIADVNAEDNPPSKRMGSDSLPPLEPLTPADGPNWWKTTYKPLNEERRPEIFLFNENMIVHDLEGRRPPVTVFKLKGVRVAGTFTGPDQKLYYRPQDAMDNFTWYGVPVEDVISEAELFDTNVPLPDRVAMKSGRLSFNERYFSVPLWRITAKSRRLSRYLDRFKAK